MSDWNMGSILDRLRALGPDWHEKLASEITREEKGRIVEAIENLRQPIAPFVLIVTDRDARTFAVEGPMVDDDPWSVVVVGAQGQGRQVNCHVPGGSAREDVEEAARVYGSEYPDMHRVPAGSIVSL